jgi:hypothetical protein
MKEHVAVGKPGVNLKYGKSGKRTGASLAPLPSRGWVALAGTQRKTLKAAKLGYFRGTVRRRVICALKLRTDLIMTAHYDLSLPLLSRKKIRGSEEITTASDRQTLLYPGSATIS